MNHPVQAIISHQFKSKEKLIKMVNLSVLVFVENIALDCQVVRGK